MYCLPRLLSRRSSVRARNAQHHSAGASAPVAVWSDATGLNTTNAKSSIDATIVSEAKAAMGSAASYPAWIAASASRGRAWGANTALPPVRPESRKSEAGVEDAGNRDRERSGSKS